MPEILNDPEIIMPEASSFKITSRTGETIYETGGWERETIGVSRLTFFFRFIRSPIINHRESD